VKLTTTTARNDNQAVAAPAHLVKCQMEKITGINPTTKVILPGVPAGTNAAAKESARRIQRPRVLRIVERVAEVMVFQPCRGEVDLLYLLKEGEALTFIKVTTGIIELWLPP
jgi:hypothetical protein